jgi:hypothetical protein
MLGLTRQSKLEFRADPSLIPINWHAPKVVSIQRSTQTLFGARKTKHNPGIGWSNEFPYSILKHVVLLIRIGIDVTVSAEETRVVETRIRSEEIGHRPNAKVERRGTASLNA